MSATENDKTRETLKEAHAIRLAYGIKYVVWESLEREFGGEFRGNVAKILVIVSFQFGPCSRGL